MNYINIIEKNTSNQIKKGTKILDLGECTAENTSKIYKVNSYLISVYKFYSNNGFEPYESIDVFMKDFESNSNNCIVRTFMTVFAILKECSRYPFFKGENRYVYSCIDEQNKIEEIIEETYYQVFWELKDTLNTNSLSNLKAYIKKGIKYKAHLDRQIKKINKVKPCDTETLEYLAKTHNMEDQYVKQDTQKLIRSILNDYICTKDQIDTLIVVKNLMRHGIPYGQAENNRFSLNYIADLCNVSEKTVKRRNKKLIDDLTVLCENEILPLMIS